MLWWNWNPKQYYLIVRCKWIVLLPWNCKENRKTFPTRKTPQVLLLLQLQAVWPFCMRTGGSWSDHIEHKIWADPILHQWLVTFILGEGLFICKYYFSLSILFPANRDLGIKMQIIFKSLNTYTEYRCTDALFSTRIRVS